MKLPNANDKNFKSLQAKLLKSGWMEEIVDTPAHGNVLRNFRFDWSIKGQLLLMTCKFKIISHPLWPEANAFLQSLNEQEEAFLHQVFLSQIPNQPPQ
jgi:hypothetical protein